MLSHNIMPNKKQRYFRNYNPDGCCIQDNQTDESISNITINASPNETVGAVKTLLQNRFGFHTYQQHLYYNNEPLANNHTLHYYGIKLGSVLRLIYGSQPNAYQFCDVFLN